MENGADVQTFEQVKLARKWHFDYTTPDRSRQEMLRLKTPLPSEHWPFGRYGILLDIISLLL